MVVSIRKEKGKIDAAVCNPELLSLVVGRRAPEEAPYTGGKIMKKLALTLAVALLWALPASADETVRHLEKQIPANNVQRVDLNIPVGEVTVEGWDQAQVHVDVKLECERRRDRCREAAEKIRVVYSQDDDGLRIEMKDWPKWGNHGLEAHIRVQVPRQLGLNADLGVGQMEITGIEGNLTADLGVGELDITLPASAVASVNADTGVGEANLSANGRHYESAGLVAKEIRWTQGTGSSKVKADVGVGEISVKLQ
jgi:Putative adhesin